MIYQHTVRPNCLSIYFKRRRKTFCFARFFKSLRLVYFCSLNLYIFQRCSYSMSVCASIADKNLKTNQTKTKQKTRRKQKFCVSLKTNCYILYCYLLDWQLTFFTTVTNKPLSGCHNLYPHLVMETHINMTIIRSLMSEEVDVIHKSSP